jgi:hypothetical protein
MGNSLQFKISHVLHKKSLVVIAYFLIFVLSIVTMEKVPLSAGDIIHTLEFMISKILA